MRWQVALLWQVGVVSAQPRIACADDAIAKHAHAEPAEDHRWLDFDPVVPPTLGGLGSDVHRDATQIRFGETTIDISGAWAENVDKPEHPLVDLESRGWRAGVRISRKIGPFTLSVDAEVDRVDTRFGRGRYRDVSISIGRTFQLSRWMRAWIALSLANREWADAIPPAGQANETTLMLSIGTTFR